MGLRFYFVTKWEWVVEFESRSSQGAPPRKISRQIQECKHTWLIFVRMAPAPLLPVGLGHGPV
jgi:hypothetical protein